MRDHFERLAAYNAWANARVYSAANALPDTALMKDAGAFFGSLFGTLTHILIADRIWMKRLTGEGPSHNALDDRPFETFAELMAERKKMDRRIGDFIRSLDATEFGSDLNYRDMSDQPHALPLDAALTHFFNHQTHHRGQAHHMLTQAGIDPPPLDFIYFALMGA